MPGNCGKSLRGSPEIAGNRYGTLQYGRKCNGDPAVLPDTHIVFEFRPLLITYTGTLDLTVGHLQELSTVARQGDATMTANGCETTITIPLNFRSIIARYNFIMEVRRDTAEGILHSWLDNVTADYSVTVPCNGGAITQSSFVKVIGSLQTNLFGTGISSTYRRLITDLTTDLLTNTVSEYSDAIVGGLLNNAVASLLA
ncbi:Group 7 allergen [Popillia japonica]|uniref:Group 7 allergen n=1 Tax=Popillia japonica TaxID=7064 RepID=A0AAW1NB43_POPJA